MITRDEVNEADPTAQPDWAAEKLAFGRAEEAVGLRFRWDTA